MNFVKIFKKLFLLKDEEDVPVKVRPFPGKAKFLVITDTHSTIHKWKDQIPEDFTGYDACLVLGDVTGKDILFIQENVLKNGLPCIGVLGNHDDLGGYDNTGIEEINGKVITLPNGIRIGGLSGSLRYKNDEAPLITDEQSVEIMDKMEECDLLITHDSVKHPEKDFAHSGLLGISNYLEKWNVPVHFYGHFHDPKDEILKNGTRSICFYGITTIEL